MGCVADSVGLVGALGALKGFENFKDSVIWSSKWILGFLKRIDLRSMGPAIIIKLNSINLTNSSNLWVPRNAKALKCIIVADEGIIFHMILAFNRTVYPLRVIL